MVGQRIGKYTILRKLGEGGMGAVYLGRHANIGTRAAIKVLLPHHLHNRNVARRFFNEARATAKIKHTGLVEVFDFGELEDGSSYLVMELLEGETLAARISRRALGPALAAEVGRQIASAVAAAHAEGIVHRDLKPENIFLVADADMPHGVRAKVLDFGIAKLRANGGTNRTASELLLGTPAYMAPEQCKGAAGVDHRTDIYAIGCVLFEMACGRVPFPYDNWADLIMAHLNEEPPDPLTLAPAMPMSLRDAILMCLAKNPARRFASSSELVTALNALAGPPRQSRSRKTARPVIEEQTRFDPELANRIAFEAGVDDSSSCDDPTVPRPRRQAQAPAPTVSPSVERIATHRWAKPGWLLIGTGALLCTVMGLVAVRPSLRRAHTAAHAAVASPIPDAVARPVATAAQPQGEAPMVTLRVESMPQGAEVLCAGVVLGTTPMKVVAKAAPGTAEIEIRSPGYLTERVRIPTDRDEDRKVLLRKKTRRFYGGDGADLNERGGA
jgi:serine/threonine-protein kinase